VILPEYNDAIRDFSEGLGRVQKNGKYGFINTKGQIIAPFIYDFATDFIAGMAFVEQNGDRFFIDRNGKKWRQNN
jgi:hypothetical protein